MHPYGAPPNELSIVPLLGREEVKILGFLPYTFEMGICPNTRAGDLGTVKFLLDGGTDQTIPTKDGLTQVILAIVCGNPLVIEILKEIGEKWSKPTEISAREEI
ncbi:MAG: hypothetical protein QXN89_04115 [Candidatus Woesearchaeota archaeon]